MSSTAYKNELVKRKFYEYLANSCGYSASSIECYEQAIWLWEDFTNKADFVGFNKTVADEFKAWLRAKKKIHAEGTVSLSYNFDTLRHLKTFFEWLSTQAGYKSQIRAADIDYLKLSRQDARVATQPKGQESPTIEEVRTVIEAIKGTSEVDMRDKALISLAFLTGARISAISSLPMASFDRATLTLNQDPRLGVKTKFSKRIVTALVPFLYKEPLDYFLAWFDYLVVQRKFAPTDPIFSATKIENGTENLGYHNTQTVDPVFWQSSTSARKIFQHRFAQAGVRYYHPHTFRHLLVKTISKLPLTEEQKKAVSQNLGHEDVGTTFGSYGYGKIAEDRQVEIVRSIDFEGRKGEVFIQVKASDLERFMRDFKPTDPGKEGSDKTENKV